MCVCVCNITNVQKEKICLASVSDWLSKQSNTIKQYSDQHVQTTVLTLKKKQSKLFSIWEDFSNGSKLVPPFLNQMSSWAGFFLFTPPVHVKPLPITTTNNTVKWWVLVHWQVIQICHANIININLSGLAMLTWKIRCTIIMYISRWAKGSHYFLQTAVELH